MRDSSDCSHCGKNLIIKGTGEHSEVKRVLSLRDLTISCESVWDLLHKKTQLKQNKIKTPQQLQKKKQPGTCLCHMPLSEQERHLHIEQSFPGGAGLEFKSARGSDGK